MKECWTNQEVSEVLRRIGDLAEISGENTYKVSAYRRAADSVASLDVSVRDLWEANQLRTIPGVGQALSGKLDELFRTGSMRYYEKLGEQVPSEVLHLLAIPDVGPRTARLMWQGLGILSIADAERAAQEGRLRTLRGIGEKSERRILEGIQQVQRRDR